MTGGKVLEREIFRSGRAIDGRLFSPKDVYEIFNNTQNYLIKKGIQIPISLGHEDRDQVLKGEIIELTLKKKKRFGLFVYDYCIFAKIRYSDPVYDLYEQGLLPYVSVEIGEDGYTEYGEKFGAHIYRVALLGTDPPAYPWLKSNFNKQDQLVVNQNGNYICFRREQIFNQKPKQNGGFSMDPKTLDALAQIMDLCNQITAMAETCAKLVPAIQQVLDNAGGRTPSEEIPIEEMSSNNPGSEEAACSPKKQNGMDADMKEKLDKLQEQMNEISGHFKAEKEKSTETAITNQFNSLHAAGKISTDQKNDFRTIALKCGLDFAVKTFSNQTAKIPPLKAITGGRQEIGSSKDNQTDLEKKWTNHYAKKGYTGEKLQRAVSLAMEYDQQREAVNV